MCPRYFVVAAIALLCLVGAGCGRLSFQNGQEPANSPDGPPVADKPAVPVVAFDSEVTLTVGASAAYSDGLVVSLERVNDSRCPAGVQCIWQGELAPVLRLRGGSLASDKELTLGTARGLTGAAGDYAVTLSGVTDDAVVAVVVTSAASRTGMIRLTSPQANEAVASPLSVVGEARGTWFFEASFPVRLFDANGQLLASTSAQAQADWMTEDFVPFQATLTFENPTTASGTLVLEKDNPSGLPQNADELRLPVIFSAPTPDKSMIFPPMAGADGRVTKKPFGILVGPEDSPVSPERFRGYHTGSDFEVTADEQDVEVPVYAVCEGRLILKRLVSGYGGVAVQACQLGGKDVTVLYGHLRLASIDAVIDQELNQGQRLGTLGQGYNAETDGERKHLHLAIHEGTAVDLRGYVSKKDDLDQWIDLRALLGE